MAFEIKQIVDAFITAVEAYTPTTDAGAPSAFRNLKSAKQLSTEGRDRWFVVRVRGGQRHNITAVGGKKEAYCDVTLEASVFNEGRSLTEFSALVADEAARLQDYIPEHIRQSTVLTAGIVRNVEAHEEYRVEPTEEPRRLIIVVPLRIHYYGDHISP